MAQQPAFVDLNELASNRVRRGYPQPVTLRDSSIVQKAVCCKELKLRRENIKQVDESLFLRLLPRLFASYCKLLYDCFKYLLKKVFSSNTKRR